VNEHQLTPKDIRKIRIATYKSGLDIVDNPQPEGAYEAKFSLQYTVAHAVVHGSVRLNAFLPDRLGDSEVRSLMQRVECIADPALSKGYPNQRAASVEIETTDGRKLSHFQPTRKGDPELPLTDSELNDKFLELAGPVIGDEAARGLLDELWRIEQRADVDLARATAAPALAAG